MRLQSQGSSSLSLSLLSFTPTLFHSYLPLWFITRFFLGDAVKTRREERYERDRFNRYSLLRMWRRGCPKRPRYIIARFFPSSPVFECTWTKALSGGYFFLFKCVARHVREPKIWRENEPRNSRTFLMSGSRSKYNTALFYQQQQKEKKRLGEEEMERHLRD